MNQYKFACGCKFNQLNDEVKESDGLPSIEIDYYNLPNCKDTWEDFGTGRTKGIFQLEKSLGRHWCKEVQPNNIHHLAALGAILRPGCISSETKIVVSLKDNRIVRKSIGQIFKNQKHYKKIISLDEQTGEFFSNNVKNVIYSGQKECFKIKISKFSNGKEYSTSRNSLECTDDHLIFTSSGWKELHDLKIGDRIAFFKKRVGKLKTKQHITHRHTSLVKIPNVEGIFQFKRICNQYYEYKCVMCDWNDGKLDCNHLDGNRHENNSPENLCFLCPNHHRMYTHETITKEEVLLKRESYKLLNPENISWFFYMGKESLGIKDTYDITVDGPNHNFIAGNVVVHNCLESLIDNKSLTQHYADNKNHRQEPTIIHPAVERILEDTHQVLIYQEQILLIAKEIAGFSGVQADTLRRGIGHKDAKVLFEMQKQFLDGCERVGKVSLDDAKMIFDIIKKSARYSFNSCLDDTCLIKAKSNTRFVKKSIKKINIGDIVKTPSGEAKVINTYNHGLQPVYKITLKSGLTINSTMKHKFLCEDGNTRMLKDIIKENHKIVCQDFSKENFEKLSHKHNKNLKAISRELKISSTCVKQYFKKYNLESNTRGFNKKYYANDNYFKTWSSNMSYILGFISADGHVWKDRPFLTIGLSKIDINILKFIRNEISPNSKVREGKDTAQICIHSEEIWKDLNDLGIDHNKTFNLKLPNIPEKYFPDYLRGYFDGDGSIWGKERKKKTHYLSSIASASETILKDIQNEIGFGKVIKHYSKNCFYINFNQNQCVLLKNIMYNGGFCLERKFEKFLKINITYNLWTKEEDEILLKFKNEEDLIKMLPNRTLLAINKRRLDKCIPKK